MFNLCCICRRNGEIVNHLLLHGQMHIICGILSSLCLVSIGVILRKVVAEVGGIGLVNTPCLFEI